jgi:vacuolar-type H+-ATPase subunit I/STV1
MLFSAELIEELEKIDPQTRSVFIKILKFVEKAVGEVVKREDFLELRKELEILTKAVRELAEAQKKTEERLTRLEQVVAELAEAQKRTEQRVEELAEAQKKTEERLTRLEQVVAELAEAQKRTEQRVEELAEAQKKTEERLVRLENTVAELAEAQKKTEERLTRLEQVVAELAEAQKRTEQRVEELAEAQEKTEERLVRLENTVASLTETVKKLTEEHKKMREQIGGLSHTVGYILEDRAFKGLPGILKRDFGIESVEYLKRDYIEISPGKYEEVNIVGRGKKDGEDVWIVGDCKTQLKKRDVDEFISTIQKIEKVIEGKKILITVVYQASPDVRKYVEEKGIRLYFSYEMPL